MGGGRRAYSISDLALVSQHRSLTLNSSYSASSLVAAKVAWQRPLTPSRSASAVRLDMYRSQRQLPQEYRSAVANSRLHRPKSAPAPHQKGRPVFDGHGGPISLELHNASVVEKRISKQGEARKLSVQDMLHEVGPPPLHSALSSLR